MTVSPSADAAVGKEIRLHRRLAGLTQKQVAERIGVTGAQFHRYETGATRIATSRLLLIATAIGVRPDIFLSAAAAPGPRQPDTEHQGQEIAELLQIFMTIADPQHRDTLVALAKMMSSPHRQLSRAPAALPLNQGDMQMPRPAMQTMSEQLETA
ncbi:helix-turn-helix domain-containing protein [Teichococcus wenyumeiae]|nr:helix-turn-helix transcriptional regulator [Pseudoroseomonas wenyumeiae]